MAKDGWCRAEWFTEEVWLACADEFGTGQGLQSLVREGCSLVSLRKVSLFEVACARRVAHLLPSELCRRTIDLAEAAADAPRELAGVTLPIYSEIAEELNRYGPPPECLPKPPLDPLTEVGLELAANLADPMRLELGQRLREMIGGMAEAVAATAAGRPYSSAEVASEFPLLHDIFGNPFRPVVFAPAWRTDAVVALARGMYEARGFTPMPVLADALDDAGCAHPDILDHCRGPGPHVRGCWVVDLVLGKA